MKTRLDILRLFDFWHGRLSAEERQEIQDEISVSPELKKEFGADSELFANLKELANQSYEAPGYLASNIMRSTRTLATEQEQQFSIPRVLGYSAACSAALAVAVAVIFVGPEYAQSPLGAAAGSALVPHGARNAAAPLCIYLTAKTGSLLTLGLAFAGLVSLGRKHKHAALIFCISSWIVLLAQSLCK